MKVIITCIPTYGPFFHAFASTLSSSYNNNRTHTTNNTYNNPHNTYATLTYLTSPTTTTSTSYPLRKTQTRNTTASSIVTNNGGRKKSRDLVDASLDEVARGLGMGGLELGLESGMLFGTSGSEEGRSVRSRSRSRSSCGGGRGRSCSPSGGYGGVWDGSGVAPTTTTICSLPAVARVREGGFGNGGCVDEDMMEAGVGGGFGVSAVGGGSSSSMVTGSAGVSGNGNGNGNGNGWRIQKIMEVRVERE